MPAGRKPDLRQLKEAILAAFLEVREDASADWVIADPELNARFLQQCRRRGIEQAGASINRTLLNLRKRGDLGHLGSRRITVRDQPEYQFAAEIAVRSLERKHRVTLDDIICDPQLAREFDSIAQEISPGYAPVQYRWAALRLRKTRRLRPEILGRVVPTEVVGPIAVSDLSLDSVRAQQGLYLFSNREKMLYIGEAQNLRARLRKHLDHSDNKFLARYIWEFGKDDLLLEYHVLPEGTRTDVRKALETELIRSRRAELNVRR
jgi:hypothetical protein